MKRTNLSGEPMRRLTSRRIIVIFLLFALIGYARWIEPNWIEVSRYSLVGSSSKSLKVAQLSDLHIRSMGYRESRVLEILKAEQPDAILITGDSIAENANYDALRIFLGELRAPLGVWLVKGNWEHWQPSEAESEIYRSSNVKLLNNSAARLTEEVWLVGVDDEMAGDPNLKEALEKVPKHAFKVGLFHSPAFFDQTNGSFNLVLSGHTHGGQVRLPFLPPLWLPEGSGRFVSGWYDNGDSRMYGLFSVRSG